MTFLCSLLPILMYNKFRKRPNYFSSWPSSDRCSYTFVLEHGDAGDCFIATTGLSSMTKFFVLEWKRFFASRFNILLVFFMFVLDSWGSPRGFPLFETLRLPLKLIFLILTVESRIRVRNGSQCCSSSDGSNLRFQSNRKRSCFSMMLTSKLLRLNSPTREYEAQCLLYGLKSLRNFSERIRHAKKILWGVDRVPSAVGASLERRRAR